MRRIDLPLVCLAFSLGAFAGEDTVSLSGKWRFQLDRADAGLAEQWSTQTLPGTIKLPGGLSEQGVGDPVTVDTKWTGSIVDKSWFTAPEFAEYRRPGNVKVPFWLQPERYYAGAAWFQREIVIPAEWEGKRVVLFLERPHWETRVWVDGRPVGTNNALATPHEYDLGCIGQASRLSQTGNGDRHDASPAVLTPGKHTLTLRVDNRLVVDVGENSHSVSDHTQGNWNGIVGRIELRAIPVSWLEELQVYPQANSRSVLVKGHLGLMGSPTPSIIELTVKVAGRGGPEQRVSATAKADGTFETTISLGAEAVLWDEFNPALYELAATLNPAHASRSTRHITFGLRVLSTDGTQFVINGRKAFFRGTLECAIFPKTGHPPTEVAEWKRLIRVCQAHGLNMIRFHSWCPPEAAFVAADELGFYFHVEASSWANQSTTMGDGKPVDRWIYEETDRILKSYGNHPSFVLMAYGNEPGGRNANAYLARWVNHYKALDPRRLWTSGAGWPQLPENQWHSTPDPRIQGWGEGLKSRINAKPPETTTDYRDYISKRSVPVISHEIGQWCVYPNFDEMKKYTGYLKARNFEIFRDRLEAHGLGKLAKPFLLASGKLQTLCYKEDIESALRTPGMGGFQLLDLHDFPGQGTALVGVLDPFWEEKGYVTAEEYSRFCNRVVPLARLAKRVFTTEEILTAELEVANFGATPLEGIQPRARLLGDDSKAHLDVRLTPQDVPIGNGIRLSPLNFDLRGLPAPARYKLAVSVGQASSLSPSSSRQPSSRDRLEACPAFENDWDLWVYPPNQAVAPADDVLITPQFDDAAQARLRSGGKVLLTIPGKQVRNFDTVPVKLGFSSIFWNTAWTGRQAPTTLGILCDPKHPALAQFPTDSHSNWQWWYLIHRAGALRLDLLPRGVEPIVRVIDDWFTARPLGLIVEGKVGRGKVIVCGFDLTRDADDPVSRQMRASLLRYMASRQFAPRTTLVLENIQSLIGDPRGVALPGVRSVKASSEQEGYEAERALDGDPATMWHTTWGELAAGFPHELVVEFESPTRLTGLTLLPRQDGNPNGWIKDYSVCVSADGKLWGEPVARGTFARNAALKTVKFTQPISAKFIKLTALSGHAEGPWASLAELRVLTDTNN